LPSGFGFGFGFGFGAALEHLDLLCHTEAHA